MNIRKLKIMKRILLSLIIMLTAASMHAQSDYVMLYLKDGTTLKMLLSESPNITYDKYNVNITTTAMSQQRLNKKNSTLSTEPRRTRTFHYAPPLT